MFSCASAETDAEFERAVKYGFISEELTSVDPDTTISYAEFMAMLDVAVSRIDAERLPGWKENYPEARSSTDSINWGNAVLAVFSAAEYLGGEVYARNCSDAGEGDYDSDWPRAAFWGDLDRLPIGFEGMTPKDAQGDFCGWASHYVTSRGSVISGKTIYSYEEGSRFIRATQSLTLKDGAIAALRFWESTIPMDHRAPNHEDAALFAKVEAKKQKILNAETDISYSGTAYYVSNHGDDRNDGRSPETAWATLDKVNEAGADRKLLPGDAVLLERGGLWRGFIRCAQGVVYSAYGEGEKTKIYGSEENGTGADKWELWYNEHGVKIWKFYRDISETGNIVFDDGESYAIRIYDYYNGAQWVASPSDSEPFDVVENLRDDLTFYSTFELSAEEFQSYVTGEQNPDEMDTAGPLYLRCDAGNPGDLYTDIEFHNSPEGMTGYIGLVTPAGDNVIDNLCLKYSLKNGIAIYGTDRYNTDCNNNIIQNCEIGWTGGIVNELNSPAGDVMVCGENIVFKTDNNLFQNNYMYQSACGGFVSEFVLGEWEGYPEALCKNNVIRGNIVEKCQDLFWFWSNVSDNPGQIFWENTVVEDNFALYGGYGWSGDERFVYPNQPLNTYHAAGETWLFALGGNPSEIKNMLVKNNVFYLSNDGWIIQTPDMWDQTYVITFSGNTYVQNDNRFILVTQGQSAMPNSLTAEEIKADLEYLLGDREAVVFATSVELK